MGDARPCASDKVKHASLKKFLFEPSLVFLLYALLTLFFFPKIFSEVYISLGDGWSQFYSRYAFFKQSIDSGIFPWWNPLVICGAPSGLEAVSDFSLTNFLLLFLDLNPAWNLSQFLTPLLSSWILFLFLRKELCLSRVAAFLGGFILLTNAVSSASDNPVYFLVALMVMTHQWVKKKSWGWGCLVSITLTYYLLNSNAQYVLYAGFFLWTYAVTELWKRSEKAPLLKASIVLIQSSTPFIFALSLSAFHLFRVYELLSLSYRGLVVGQYIHMLFPTDLLLMFYPNFYKSSIHPELSFLLSNAVSKVIAAISSDRIFQIYPPYIGQFPLMFGALMFFKKEKTGFEKFLLAFSVGIIIYLMLNPMVFTVTRWIPVLNQLPAIWRIYNLYYLGMAILAAFFVEYLQQQSFEEKFHLNGIVHGISVVLVLVIGVILLRLVFQILLSVYQELLASFLKDTLLPRMLENPRFRASPEFYLGRLQQFLLALRSWVSFGNPFFLLPAFLWLINLFWFQRVLRAKISKNMFLLGLFPLLFLDFFTYKKAVTSFVPEELVPHHQEVAFLHGQPGLFRVMPLQPVVDENNPPLLDPRVDTRNVIMRPETSQIYGLATPEGYRSLLPLRYARFIELLSGKSVAPWTIGEFERVNKSLADLINVKYILTTAQRELGGGYRKIYENQNRAIFLNENVLERAFLVHKARNYKDSESAFRQLESQNLDFSEEVILENGELPEGKHLFGQSSENDKVEITHYSANRVDLDIHSEFGGFLVLTDAHFPGWKATVGGSPRKILYADLVFRGLEIPPGRHSVRFVYQPDSLRLGLWVSAASLVLGICFWGFSVIREHYKNQYSSSTLGV